MNGAAYSYAAGLAPELNPALDLSAVSHMFSRNGRVHIPDALTPISAERIHHALRSETRWTLIVNKDGTPAALSSPPPLGERMRHGAAAWEHARDKFAYIYDNHRLSFAGEGYEFPQGYFARVVAFLNSPAFIGAMRRITGVEAIAFADAQATVYRPGDFLTGHDDDAEGKNRVAAYVLNLTRGWRSDWGGELQFLGAEGEVLTGYAPAFNALNLFSVPQRHRVNRVALEGGNRYSITGWLRTR